VRAEKKGFLPLNPPSTVASAGKLHLTSPRLPKPETQSHSEQLGLESLCRSLLPLPVISLQLLRYFSFSLTLRRSVHNCKALQAFLRHPLSLGSHMRPTLPRKQISIAARPSLASMYPPFPLSAYINLHDFNRFLTC
jgi:hypothetical protein